MQDIRTELAETLDEAEWNWLIPHVKRDAVVIVAQQLDILDVGEAIACDHLDAVQNWISEELISKPSPAQLSDWNGELTKRFNTLIVQPYVLVQELTAA